MNILFIDDNTTVQRIYYTMLLSSGFLNTNDNVDFFCSTNFLIDNMISFDKYQIIICDLELGSESSNGLQFFEKVNEKFHGLKILFTADNSLVLQKIIDLDRRIKLVTKANPKKNIEKTIQELGNLINFIRNEQ